MTDSQRNLIYRLGLIILLVATVYGSTLTHGFVWDDAYIIVNNPLLEKLGNIPRFFLTEDTVEEPTGYYRPVTYISFALDRVIWGVNPAGFHLTNLVLHILVALLFYAVIAAIFKKERLAFAAALIFALHPVTVETVNFLSGGRNTLLSACFGLLALLFHIRKNQIPALASFTLAIFSKEFALLLPLVFLLYDWRLQRDRIRFSGYLLYLVPVACYLTLRSVAVQKANFLSTINLTDMTVTPYLVVRYILNMLFPFQLKVLYDVQPSLLISMICLAVIVVLMAAAWLFRKHDAILFSACWMFLFLLPVINIIPLHTTTVMADRYSYFSLMGTALLLATVICRWNGRSVTAGVVILCALYVLIDVNRNGAWKNEIGFFTRMTQDSPDKYVGFQNLGKGYYQKGEISHALAILETATSKPDIPINHLIGVAYIFWKENMPNKAEKVLLRALELEPGNLESYLILMMISEQNGNIKLAQSCRNKLIKVGYRIDKVLVNRTIELCRTGEAYMSKRQYVDAEILFWQALRINPDYIPALIDMGSLRAEQVKLADAIHYFSKVLALEPFNISAHYNLAMVYQMQGRTADAQAEMIRSSEAKALLKQKGKPVGQ